MHNSLPIWNLYGQRGNTYMLECIFPCRPQLCMVEQGKYALYALVSLCRVRNLLSPSCTTPNYQSSYEMPRDRGTIPKPPSPTLSTYNTAQQSPEDRNEWPQSWSVRSQQSLTYHRHQMWLQGLDNYSVRGQNDTSSSASSRKGKAKLENPERRATETHRKLFPEIVFPTNHLGNHQPPASWGNHIHQS